MLIGEGNKVTLGKPTIEGAKVVATLKSEGKGKKIVVFKYKAKVRYRRKLGHRQPFSRLIIEKIVEPQAA